MSYTRTEAVFVVALTPLLLLLALKFGVRYWLHLRSQRGAGRSARRSGR